MRCEESGQITSAPEPRWEVISPDSSHLIRMKFLAILLFAGASQAFLVRREAEADAEAEPGYGYSHGAVRPPCVIVCPSSPATPGRWRHPGKSVTRSTTRSWTPPSPSTARR